jgi:long-chain acyl-CoA synthetase
MKNAINKSITNSNFTLNREVFSRFSKATAVIDDLNHSLSYSDILGWAQLASFRASQRRLVMCQVNNDIGGIGGYLALLAADAVPMMISPTLQPSAIHALIKDYQPEFIWLPQSIACQLPNTIIRVSLFGYCLLSLSTTSDESDLHPDLALLLSTSGSTGGRKYVRLSKQNLWSNAAAIADYLSLSPDELPVTTLPPSYSYGLSVIHSHLLVGACQVVTNKTFFDREFWDLLSKFKVTSMAGVPYHYEILKKLRFTKMDLPHLRMLTQAGGRMSTELTQEFANHCRSKGMCFFTMYGQTEASPRISYVPSVHAFSKAGTIGIPIPGGELELRSETGSLVTEAHVAGEMVYRGPNVCLGYAESRADLLLGDHNRGVLYTGDLAERDDDGYYRIVGRKKRFIKLFGNRVNLQDIEEQLSDSDAVVACSGNDDILEVYVAGVSAAKALEIKQAVMAKLRVGGQGVAVYGVDDLPRNESGKIRYLDLYPETARLLA